MISITIPSGSPSFLEKFSIQKLSARYFVCAKEVLLINRRVQKTNRPKIVDLNGFGKQEGAGFTSMAYARKYKIILALRKGQIVI